MQKNTNESPAVSKSLYKELQSLQLVYYAQAHSSPKTYSDKVNVNTDNDYLMDVMTGSYHNPAPAQKCLANVRDALHRSLPFDIASFAGVSRPEHDHKTVATNLVSDVIKFAEDKRNKVRRDVNARTATNYQELLLITRSDIVQLAYSVHENSYDPLAMELLGHIVTGTNSAEHQGYQEVLRDVVHVANLDPKGKYLNSSSNALVKAITKLAAARPVADDYRDVPLFDGMETPDIDSNIVRTIVSYAIDAEDTAINDTILTNMLSEINTTGRKKKFGHRKSKHAAHNLARIKNADTQ